MSSSNQSNKATKQSSSSSSVAQSAKRVSYKDVVEKNLPKPSIPRVSQTKSKDDGMQKKVTTIPNPYTKKLPHDVLPSPPITTGTPLTPDTEMLATQVSHAVRFHPTPPDSIDPTPTVKKPIAKIPPPAKPAAVKDTVPSKSHAAVVTNEKAPKEKSGKRTRFEDEEAVKPSPSEYKALYNAGPKAKKKKKKPVPQRAKDDTRKPKGRQLPTRASVAPKKKDSPPTPPLPDLNKTVTKLAKHFNSEANDSSDDSSEAPVVLRVEKKPKAADFVPKTAQRQKRHSPENYIQRNSLVKSFVRKYDEKGHQYELKECQGMVLGPVGKNTWRVAFFGESSYRDMSSNRLTLLKKDYLESSSDSGSDKSSDMAYVYSDEEGEKQLSEYDNDEIKFLRVLQPDFAAAQQTQVPIKNEEQQEDSDCAYWDYLDSDDEKKEYDITRKRKAAQARIDSQAGKRIKMTRGKDESDTVIWTLVADDYQNKHEFQWNRERRDEDVVGIKSVGLRHFLKNNDLPLAHLYLYLAHPDGDASPAVARMNNIVEEENTKKSREHKDLLYSAYKDNYDLGIDEISEPDIPSSATSLKSRNVRLTKYFDLRDLLVFYALFIGAADASARGYQLWSCGSRSENQEEQWTTLIPQVDFGVWMAFTRFKEVKKFFTRAWEDINKKREGDPWWQVIGRIEEFNWNRKELLNFSNIIVFDEIMSGFRPRTTEKGCNPAAPHLTFNKDKPAEMGHQAHNGSCGQTKAIGHLDLDRGAEGNKTLPYFKELGATASCCKRLVEGMSQMAADACNELVIADSWFGNMKSLRTLTEPEPITGQRRDVIFCIKQGYSLFPKQELKDLLKTAPPGCHAIFRGVDKLSRQNLWAIGWKFNSNKVMTFLATDRAGSIAPSPNPYKIRFPDQYGNLRFRNIPRPGIVNLYYQYNNKIDVHNNFRQNFLGLEKKWITLNPYFRMLTTIIGVDVVDCYYLALHHNLMAPLRNSTVGGAPPSIQQFAGVLSTQLLALANRNSTYSPDNTRPHTRVAYPDSDDEDDDEEVDYSDIPDLLNVNPRAIQEEVRDNKYELRGYMVDKNDKPHTVCLLQQRVARNTGKKYRNPVICSQCHDKNTIVFCLECQRPYCYPLRRNNPNEPELVTLQLQSCFQRHVDRSGGRATRQDTVNIKYHKV